MTSETHNKLARDKRMKRGDLVRYRDDCKWVPELLGYGFAVVMKVEKNVYVDRRGKKSNRVIIKLPSGNTGYEPQSALEVVVAAKG